MSILYLSLSLSLSIYLYIFLLLFVLSVLSSHPLLLPFPLVVRKQAPNVSQWNDIKGALVASTSRGALYVDELKPPPDSKLSPLCFENGDDSIAVQISNLVIERLLSRSEQIL